MNKQFRRMVTGTMTTLGFALLVVSCKEKGTIDLTDSSTFVDTTYMAAVETPQLRNVLMEELTGVSCPPCPAGHEALASIIHQYETNATTHESRVKAVGIQIFNFPQTKPTDLTQHDNRSQKGTDLVVGVFGSVTTIPVSGIDRIIKDGATVFDRTKWITEVANRMTLPTKVNLAVTSAYNTSTKIATIRVRAAYTADVAKKQLLTVAIVENEVIDAQEDGRRDPDVEGPIDTFYHHQHVLREILTNPTGNIILNDFATKEKGRVYERIFTYDFTDKALWVPQNCHVVAYISDAESGDKEVQQAADTKLTP